MSNSQSNEPPLLPPAPGQESDCFSFHAFPLRELPCEIREDVDPWFNQFTGKSPEEVRELLRREWQSLRPACLRALAEKLSSYHVWGILHSKHPDGDRNAWLVIACLPAPADNNHIDAILRGYHPAGARYLAPPYTGPLRTQIDPNDVVINFFVNFGGLREYPPFQGASSTMHQNRRRKSNPVSLTN